MQAIDVEFGVAGAACRIVMGLMGEMIGSVVGGDAIAVDVAVVAADRSINGFDIPFFVVVSLNHIAGV